MVFFRIQMVFQFIVWFMIKKKLHIQNATPFGGESWARHKQQEH